MHRISRTIQQYLQSCGDLTALWPSKAALTQPINSLSSQRFPAKAGGQVQLSELSLHIPPFWQGSVGVQTKEIQIDNKWHTHTKLAVISVYV